jgi:uncharacterized protein
MPGERPPAHRPGGDFNDHCAHRAASGLRPERVRGLLAAAGNLPRPTLGSVEAWAAPDGAVETGTCEATAGTFARATVDAEFCHFVRGHATFVTEDGRRFEFKTGDAAYFPPRTHGTWTIHETLRKTYCIWR